MISLFTAHRALQQNPPAAALLFIEKYHHARRFTFEKAQNRKLAGEFTLLTPSLGPGINMANLEDAGWRLTEEGKKLCGNSVKAALDLDIRDIGAECLPEEINRGKASVLEGGFVLQVIFDIVRVSE